MRVDDKGMSDITLTDEITLDDFVRICEIKHRLLAIYQSL
jgi:hypothetical protein